MEMGPGIPLGSRTVCSGSAWLLHRGESNFVSCGYVLGPQFGLRLTLRQPIGDSAAFNLDSRQEISVVVAVKNQGTGTSWLLGFVHLGHGKQTDVSVGVLNQERAARSHRLHGHLTWRNGLVPENKAERHLGRDPGGAAQLRKRSTSRNQHQRKDQHCTLHKTLPLWLSLLQQPV